MVVVVGRMGAVPRENRAKEAVLGGLVEEPRAPGELRVAGATVVAEPREVALRKVALREVALPEVALQVVALRKVAQREVALREVAQRKVTLREVAQQVVAQQAGAPSEV